MLGVFRRQVLGVPLPDALLALGLLGFGVALNAGQGGGLDMLRAPFLAIVALAVGWRSRAPLLAALAVALAAPWNGLFGRAIVECGVTLPAIFAVAYSCGARLAPRPAMAGGLFALSALLAVGVTDPVFAGATDLAYLIPLTVGVW